jgi:hypothetical protein
MGRKSPEGFKMQKKKIVITGNANYINRLAAHLKKEHPSTRRRLKTKQTKISRIE